MKNERQRESSQYLQPCKCFVSPGAALEKAQGRGCALADRPCGFSPSLLEEKGGSEGTRVIEQDFAVCFVTNSFSMFPTAESMAAWCKSPVQEQISTLQPAVLISR